MIIGCLLLAVSLGCTKGESPGKGAEKPDAKTKDSEKAKPEDDKTAPSAKKGSDSGEAILEKMVTAYKNAKSYADHGQLRLNAVVAGENRNLTAPFMLAMERPNKLRMEAYGAKIVSNDDGFFATVDSIPGQVLEKPALERIDILSFFSDMLLTSSWLEGQMKGNLEGFIISIPPPQVQLLFGDNPLKELLSGVENIRVLEQNKIDGRVCHRVRILGAGTFWIDSKDYVLRRLELPPEIVERKLREYGPATDISLVADFADARLDGKIAQPAFQFEAPKEAVVVKQFLPAPIRMLGTKEPNMQFVDLDGKAVKLESLAGKVVVLDFWASWCGPCRQSMPNTEKVYQQFKDNPNVAFFAVSVDDPQTDDERLKKTLAQLNVNIPILRDPKQSAGALRFDAIPTLYIIGPKGILQACVIGGDPKITQTLPAKIDALLQGKNIFEQSKQEYGEILKSLVKMVANELTNSRIEPSNDGEYQQQTLPEVKTAPRSEPQRLKMTRLWKCDKVKTPGNILIVKDGGGPARMLTVENWKSVAEIGLDGKLIAVHPLELAELEMVGSLRTAVDNEGKRYYLAFLLSQQRCHIYDENWKLIAHYPEDALEVRHTGIADAEIGDLDGDGKPNIYVSYWGLAGVQGASLEGRRLWSNRSVSEVSCIAIGSPLVKGSQELYCTTGGGEIAVLDGKGELKKNIIVIGHSFQWIASADLRGDGHWLWSGMAAPQIGGNTAVGFAENGSVLWEYAMPSGIPQYPIDPVIPGLIASEGPGQWLLPGPDGSVHILSADGVLLDKFNYGAPLHGLATTEINGRPALIVAADGVVEAFAIDLK